MDDLSALRSALVRDDFAVVNQLRDKHQRRLQNELHGTASSFNSLVDDPIAKVLLAPLTSGLRPEETPGYGNCFFNAASIALVGNSTLSSTLRLLTAAEIARCDFNYFLHPIIDTSLSTASCGHHKDTHVSMIISDEEIETLQRTPGDKAALHKLAILTAGNGYWAGLMHFLALSNVTGYRVKSVYPDIDNLCPHMTSLLNRSLEPPHGKEVDEIAIMWSTLQPPVRNGIFQPNHFVALIKDDFESDDDIYNEKKFAILDPALLVPSGQDSLEPTSEWEPDEHVPLKQVKTSPGFAMNDSTVWESEDEVPLVAMMRQELGLSDSDDDVSVSGSVNSSKSVSDDSSGEDGDGESDKTCNLDSGLQWQAPFRNIRKKPFLGNMPGPKIILAEDSKESDLFLSFLQEDFFKNTANASNKYTQVYGINRHLFDKDIRMYIGIRIIMGLDPKPCLDDYWSTDTCLRNAFISKTISKAYYKSINRLFHVDEPKNNHASSLERVNELLSTLKEKSKDFYNLHENVSIDEAMIKFHGKHSGVVGAPNKPPKGVTKFILSLMDTLDIYLILSATLSRKIRSSKGWQTVDLKTVESIVQYNKHMGGADRHDHLRSNYTIQRPGHRWWKYFVWFLMAVALVNAYILYKTLKDKKISHKQFRLAVACQLVGGYTVRSNRARQSDSALLDKNPIQNHERTSFIGRPRVCRLCSKRKIKTRSGCLKDTRDGCLQCQVHLHKDCFRPYHEEACASLPVTATTMSDAVTQTENACSTPQTAFSRKPIIQTPSRLRKSPRKIKLKPHVYNT
ncbi:PiggyBac transposable element-derived protein 4-like [Elysia marginata]|uniref:PiggyBac transposable element-derived protein 4-like n=1 Tax=Elysia marginata TaxID=1093978 RepID=A0AAV4GGX4_9GAST|nr:PiggyBac transposable element-derived protein 4-like [Elysia marginata]